MMHSLHNSAQLATAVEADVTGIAALRSEHENRFLVETGVKLSFLPFFAKATVEALLVHPVLAAAVNADCTEITLHDEVNLGIAVDGPKGLLVPVIHGAHRSIIGKLAVVIERLAESAREDTITPDALAGGTFTVTNTGSRGALFDTPILNHPQSGILGTGAVVDKVIPWRDDHGGDGFAVRSVVCLSATYDHRVVDGANAARFLNSVKDRIEQGFGAPDLFP